MGPDIFSVSCSTHGVRDYFQSSDEISLKKMYLRPGWEDILRVVAKGQGVHTGESCFFHAMPSSVEVINPRQSRLWPLPISSKRCDTLSSPLFLKHKDVSCNFMGFKYLILLLSTLKDKFRLSNL